MAKSEDEHQNRLANESSPYLLQHANNPVDWYPWSEEAFEKARKEDKPVLVSIGYATCHWCHVMAHESFEDEQTAALMNEAFINIKVDREERPDIDNTYMLVCQMLTGSGGWPLNVFLTPEKKPFYAATYIPMVGRHGRPGMRELIPWLSQLWENERKKILNSSEEIIQAFQKSNTFESGGPLGAEILEKAYKHYEQQFDKDYGGFGSSPKFPSPHNLMLLLRYAKRHPESKALEMVEKTLTQMRRGGLFDHIGFGFHRYSTDREWVLPHFEKMLYDQALLLMAYVEAWQLTQKPLFKQTAEEICSYLKRKMQDERGGFYSAEDADSEGEEGKFYVWSVAEVREVLPAAEAELAIEIFNLKEGGNFEDEATGRRTGKNIPHLKKNIEELAVERNIELDALESAIESIRQKLLSRRKDRVHPLLDDKILADWNGLIIAALAKAGRAFGNSDFIAKAEECWQFVHKHMIADGVVKHRYRNSDVAIDAHADDYAFLVWGLVELYGATFKSQYLSQAVTLNKQFIDLFWDEEKGGFYFTSESAEELLGRKKEIYDGAMPSSNSVGMMNLLKLGRITGHAEWEAMADEAAKLFATDIERAPTGFGAALHAVDFVSGPTQEIIIAGDRENNKTQEMLARLNMSFLPNTVVVLNDHSNNNLTEEISYLSEFEKKDGHPTAYVCQNYSCELPTTDPDEMMTLINDG